MSRFLYRARRENGSIVQGELSAPTPDRAKLLLQANKLTPLNVTEQSDRSLFDSALFGGTVTTKDLILFSRQSATMIQAGVPIVQTMQALLKQVSKRHFRDILQRIIHDVEGGDSFSIALTKHSAVFSPFFLGMVRTGEASGQLSHTLASIADYLEQDYTFRRKVLASLLYPSLILVTMVIVTIIIFVFVLPQLVQLFADAKVELPLPTRLLLGVVNFWKGYWYIILSLLVAMGLVLRSYLKTREGRFTLSTLVLRLPLLRALFQRVYLARLTSMLKTLSDSDVPIIESFQLAEQAVGNKVYQRILADTIQAIKDGASIASTWEHEPFMPPLLTTMVSVGERSGKIDQAFAEAQRFFQREVDDILSVITVLIEPIVVILLGVGVAIIVASVFLPIYNLVLTI